MKKLIYLFFILIVSFQFACMIKKTPLAGLKFEIEKKLFIDSAHFGVAFKNVQTGETLLINEKESFHAASTMKMPVLIELYRQAKAGKFSMTDSIEIKNSFKSIVDGSEFSLDSADDSQFELYKAIGQRRSIADLAYIMIILSSNMATNMLIELVTADSVMKTMRSLGAKDIKVLRGVEDNKAFEKGLNNTTTAYDQMLLYNLLAKEKLVDSIASKEMTNILLDQKFNEVIPAKLPPEVKVAHKTGSITGVQHDAGVVMLPDGRKYVLVLLSRFKKEDEKKVIEAMADVSKLVYDYVLNHR